MFFEIASSVASNPFTLLLEHLWVLVARVFVCLFSSVLSYHLLPHPPDWAQEMICPESSEMSINDSVSPNSKFVAFSYYWWDFLMMHQRPFFMQCQRHLLFANKYKFVVDRPQIFLERLSSTWFWCEDLIITYSKRKKNQQHNFREWHWWLNIK